MVDMIENDALVSTPETLQGVDAHDHGHEEVKTFIATPRFDPSLMERMVGLFKSRDKPGVHVVRKDDILPRLMVVVTSNSYMDREGETITSAALKAYEDSCYPGGDLFHCDNPLLWWHDDDIVMGEAVAVNYSEPFLIEVFRELPTLASKVLFDFAEGNGDNAGASHRFGYLEKDRDPDGTFHRIFKQETSYLPERSLAANTGTFAGVMGMASSQSDKRLDEIFAPLGVKNAAAKFHAKTGEIEKELEALGIAHKAAKLPFPPKPPADPLADPVVEEDESAVIEEDAGEEAKEELLSEGGKIDLTRMMILLNGILDMMGNTLDAAAASEMDRVGMMKMMDEWKELRVSEKAQEKVTLDTLEQRLKAMQSQIDGLAQKMNQTPRSVQNEKGLTQQELETSTNALANALKNIGKGEVKTHPIFGVPYDPSKIPTYDKE